MKKTIIYGGSGGIGFAIAKRLCEAGEAVHLVGRNAEKIGACAAQLKASCTIGDVLDTNLFEQVADAVPDATGMVYAVGTLNLKSIQRLTEADYLNDFRVNALGAALAVRACAPALKKHERAGAVVLFSSVAAVQGFSMHASIGMAKAAVSGLTLSLAAELAPKIRLNAIAPSVTRTPLSQTMLSNESVASAIAAPHAMQRVGEPDDVAALAVFLMSHDADWITGQIFSADGGRSTLRTKN